MIIRNCYKISTPFSRTFSSSQPVRTMASSSSTTTAKKPILFGPFEVTTQVFLTTPHSFALVNLKPLLPGHVLVCPYKRHARLTDLSPPELTDLWTTVQRVQRMLAAHHFTGSSPSSPYPAPPEKGSFNIALQDGKGAGQTVPHVHVHVIPRFGETAKPGDTAGDELYERMAEEDGNVGGALWDREHGKRPEAGGKFPRIEDCEREARSMEEMEAEARIYREVLRRVEGGKVRGGIDEESWGVL